MKKLKGVGGFRFNGFGRAFQYGVLQHQHPVRALFSRGEQGVAYDFNDLSTLFQDSAGTTPVTAAGQPVGLMLDKSRGLVRGQELYSGGATGWTAGAEWVISGNTATVVGTGSFTNLDKTVAGTVASKFYTLTLNVNSVSGGALRVSFGGSVFALIATPGIYTLYLNTTTSTGLIRMQAGSGVTASVRIDNISVRELPGNHAFQTTAASRPTLRQTPILGNELVVNGDFSGGTTGWSATQASLSVTAGVLRISNTAVATGAGWQTLPTVAGKVYEVFFDRVANLGATKATVTNGAAPSFAGDLAALNVSVSGIQRMQFTATSGQSTFAIYVNSGTVGHYADVDNISVREITGYYTDRNYLEFDGVDDFLVTNSIDFTGTDKVTVFAGVRKRSDAATGIVCELGTDSYAVNSSFGLYAPASAGVQKVQFGSRGTLPSLVNTTSASFNAPVSMVVGASAAISTDSNSLRINGTQVGLAATDQGTGNYGNYPLYIGRRAGTTLPFNGHLYGLVIVGRLCTEREIKRVEAEYAKMQGILFPSLELDFINTRYVVEA